MYTWKIDGKGYICLENQASSTMIYADSVSFLTSTNHRIQKYSSMSVAFPGQIQRRILYSI